MSLENLLSHEKQTTALSQIAGLISWDQEAMMPPKGAHQRAEQAGALAQIIHDRRTDPKIGEWLESIDEKDLSQFDRRNVSEIRRTFDRATKVPGKLASEIAIASSKGQQIWAASRKSGKYTDFLPALKRNIELKREEAACIAGNSDPQSLYDALLDEFEPGAKTKELSNLLESLRPRLKALREKIAEKPAPLPLKGVFPADRQMKLARKLATIFGYDFEAGRIDKVVHPFCSGSGDDVRITTRTDEADPFNCLYSTIHEVGHALYAQGTPDPFMPAAEYCSMGVHESQSRFWENQIARSDDFSQWLYPAMVEEFGTMNVDSPEALHAAVNRVE
ncbi:MAG: carboxypeptidase M32, partial [Rhizobiaceae bacterium]